MWELWELIGFNYELCTAIRFYSALTVENAFSDDTKKPSAEWSRAPAQQITLKLRKAPGIA